MKLIGRTLVILAAALVVVGFWLAVGALIGSAGAVASSGHDLGGHGMENGFNLAGIVEVIPTLATVAIVTAVTAPIKQRLLSKRRPGVAPRPQVAAPPAA